MSAAETAAGEGAAQEASAGDAAEGAAFPYRFFDLRVLRTERLSPSLLRVVFDGPELTAMVCAGRDNGASPARRAWGSIKLFFPQDGQEVPVVPWDSGPDWYDAWRALDPDVRGIMRTFTVRELRREPCELVVDFALHSPTGPAGRWAGTAAPGHRVGAFAPVDADNAGYDFRPPADAPWVLLTADETALPAVAGILAELPADLPVRVWAEVADPADRSALPAALSAHVTWLVRGTDPAVVDAVRGAELPAGVPYAWIAGESGAVRELRRHLVGERGYDKRRVTFSGYWRRGASEDDLLEKDESA